MGKDCSETSDRYNPIAFPPSLAVIPDQQKQLPGMTELLLIFMSHGFYEPLLLLSISLTAKFTES